MAHNPFGPKKTRLQRSKMTMMVKLDMMNKQKQAIGHEYKHMNKLCKL